MRAVGLPDFSVQALIRGRRGERSLEGWGARLHRHERGGGRRKSGYLNGEGVKLAGGQFLAVVAEMLLQTVYREMANREPFTASLTKSALSAVSSSSSPLGDSRAGAWASPASSNAPQPAADPPTKYLRVSR